MTWVGVVIFFEGLQLKKVGVKGIRERVRAAWRKELKGSRAGKHKQRRRRRTSEAAAAAVNMAEEAQERAWG